MKVMGCKGTRRDAVAQVCFERLDQVGAGQRRKHSLRQLFLDRSRSGELVLEQQVVESEAAAGVG